MDVWKLETHREVKRGIALVERLARDANSQYRAEQIGGMEHLGWDNQTYLLAALLDAVNQQSKGKALRESEKVKRPRVGIMADHKPKSVKDTDFSVLFSSRQ